MNGNRSDVKKIPSKAATWLPMPTSMMVMMPGTWHRKIDNLHYTIFPLKSIKLLNLLTRSICSLAATRKFKQKLLVILRNWLNTFPDSNPNIDVYMTASSRLMISAIESLSFITAAGEVINTYARDDTAYMEHFLVSLGESRIPNVKFFVRLEGKDTGSDLASDTSIRNKLKYIVCGIKTAAIGRVLQLAF